MVPHRKAMTPDAVKRIEAIESMEDLGAGFVLATHDLEIRGAGELLGEEQSGQIQEIGFGLYSELLDRAVAALKSGRQPDLDKPLHQGPEIDIQAPALLPESYLPDVHTRLIMYKRIANAPDVAALRELQVEMIDRFGLLPDPARTLFQVTELKLKTEQVGVRRIEAGPEGGRIVFTDQPRIDFGTVMRLIQERSNIYRLDGQDRLRFTLPLPDADSRIQTVDRLLTDIAA
jgi:transcription-repair coupling factor (superfamily II helicase)